MTIDHFTYGGATLLAERIKTYWSRRGYDVHTWLEVDQFQVEPIYYVRSNLVDGLPRPA